MERTMSVEEKIRRAEEIYQRRREGNARPVATVNVNEKKDLKLLKKMIIQLLVCVSIYFVIYMIQNSQSVFSQDFLKKANEILSYDTNFGEIYQNAKNQIVNWMETQKEEKTEENGIGGADEGHPEGQQEEQLNETTNEEVEQTQTEEQLEEQNLSQEEQDIINIKNTTTFIKPVEGVISSNYGQREQAPQNHTGTDIAAQVGTKIKSATDGEVVLASEEGDYRKTSKNSNW